MASDCLELVFRWLGAELRISAATDPSFHLRKGESDRDIDVAWIVSMLEHSLANCHFQDLLEIKAAWPIHYFT